MAGAPSVRRLSSDCRVYALTPCVEPAYHVAPGETLVIETADAMDGQIPALGRCVAEVDASRANPLTGPIAVEGAEPRMMLAVQILEVAVAQEGWMSRSPSGAVCPVTDNLAYLGQLGRNDAFALPISPMIGAIGVAPAEGSYSSRNAGPWGGNLDIKEIGAGTTMFLPVGVRGAHLALGDVHALQADGESSGTGIEIGADVTLRIQALDKALAPTLHFHRHGVLYTVGASACLATACRAAAEAMAGIVSAASGWDRDHGFMYVSLAADVRVGQFVCNTRTAYAALDLKTCPWPIHVPHALG